MELHVKTRGPGPCRRNSTHGIHNCKERQLNKFAARTGLRLNTKKTQVLKIYSKCKNRILINDQELKEVDKYNYLDANVSNQGGGGDDIVKRIYKARV